MILTHGKADIQSGPSVGAALYVDGDGVKHFYEPDVYDPSSIPSGYESVGVVAARYDSRALILHKTENEGTKFAVCWQHEITGITDKLGTEIAIQFRQETSSSNVDIGSPLVFTPQTLADAVAAIDAHLRSNPGGTAAGAVANYNWHCELMENYLGEESAIVIIDNNANYSQTNSIVNPTGTTSGVSSTVNMCNFLPEYGDGTMLRVNGGFGYRPGWNFERLKQWATTNTTIANPSSMVSVHDGSNIVNQNQFENNQYCADLRATYGTFEKYIESLMLRWPCRKGAQWNLYGKGKEYTYQLASKTNKDISGTIVATYPPASWVKAIAADSDGLRAGDWYIPQMDECVEIFAPMKLDGSDPVNATLKKMTGKACSLQSSRWVSSRYDDNRTLMAAYDGAFNGYYFSSIGLCEAVALINV